MDVSSLTTATQFAFVYPQTEKVFFGIGCAEVQLRKLLVERIQECAGGDEQERPRLSSDRSHSSGHSEFCRELCFSGSREHTPSACVAKGAEIVAGARPDVIVVVGQGAPSIRQKGLPSRPPVLPRMSRHVSREGRIEALPLGAPKLPIFAVPTTLSGLRIHGDDRQSSSGKRMKYVFRDASLAPRVVMLDPSFAAHTPEALWAGTGLKLIDHCVERILAKNSTRRSTCSARRRSA